MTNIQMVSVFENFIEKSKMRGYMKKISVVFILLVGLTLGACTKAPPDAPCDNYGKNCEPKIKINQWTPTEK